MYLRLEDLDIFERDLAPFLNTLSSGEEGEGFPLTIQSALSACPERESTAQKLRTGADFMRAREPAPVFLYVREPAAGQVWKCRVK